MCSFGSDSRDANKAAGAGLLDDCYIRQRERQTHGLLGTQNAVTH